MTDAQIYEQGYRAYGGERTGVAGAVRSLIFHSIKSVMGIGRSARHKIVPVAVIGFAFVPAIVFVGVAALLPGDLQDDVLPSYAEYYGFITAALFLFAAFIAPELLCTDRRTGMLGVYLASPLDRTSYLFGKTISIFSILSIVTIGPPLLLLIALTFEDAGPASFDEGIKLAVRIIASGAAMSALYAAISMAVSATTERKGVATAATLGLLVGSAAVANGVVDGGDLSPSFLLGDLIGLPLEVAFRTHGEQGDFRMSDISTLVVWLTLIGIVTVCAVWVWDRYRRMLVRR